MKPQSPPVPSAVRPTSGSSSGTPSEIPLSGSGISGKELPFRVIRSHGLSYVGLVDTMIEKLATARQMMVAMVTRTSSSSWDDRGSGGGAQSASAVAAALSAVATGSGSRLSSSADSVLVPLSPSTQQPPMAHPNPLLPQMHQHLQQQQQQQQQQQLQIGTPPVSDAGKGVLRAYQQVQVMMQEMRDELRRFKLLLPSSRTAYNRLVDRIYDGNYALSAWYVDHMRVQARAAEEATRQVVLRVFPTLFRPSCFEADLLYPAAKRLRSAFADSEPLPLSVAMLLKLAASMDAALMQHVPKVAQSSALSCSRRSLYREQAVSGAAAAFAAACAPVMQILMADGSTETVAALEADHARWPAVAGLRMAVPRVFVATMRFAPVDAESVSLEEICVTGIDEPPGELSSHLLFQVISRIADGYMHSLSQSGILRIKYVLLWLRGLDMLWAPRPCAYCGSVLHLDGTLGHFLPPLLFTGSSSMGSVYHLDCWSLSVHR